MHLKPTYQILTPTLGEICWSESPTDVLLKNQLAWKNWISTNLNSELIDLRLGFTRISIHWKSFEAQQEFASKFNEINPPIRALSEKVWEIPVCYDPDLAPDLIQFSESKKMAIEEIISIHSEKAYRIHFFGFLPGFMYLNGLNEKLVSSRKSTPARKVDAGSVAIGGAQTGIYTLESPGGWHVIGKTPISFFDPNQTPPVWAEIGDQIQFVPISKAEFSRIESSQNISHWK